MNMKMAVTHESLASKKLMKKMLSVLGKRSKKSLSLARRQILAMKIESEEGRNAQKHYASNLNDLTHPGILSLACEAVGGGQNDVLHVQVILLLLSAAIDLHDDIIDATKTKNGKPTIYGVFGKEVALLIGDAFWMEAFVSLCRYEKALSPQVIDNIAEVLQKTLSEVGNAHLLENELAAKPSIDPYKYLKIIEKKGSNIELLTRIGAIIGNGSDEAIRALGEYGRILGTLITLREEFIDVFEPEELRNRLQSGVLPIPILFAMQNTATKEKILKLLHRKPIPLKSTEDIVRMIFESEEVAELFVMMQRLSEKALATLSATQEIHAETLTLLVKSTLEDLQMKT